jgi:hypothetical protein
MFHKKASGRLRGWRKARRSIGNGDCMDTENSAGSAPHSGLSRFLDLVALVAILATGTLLVLIGHVGTGGLSTACVAFGGLFALWLGIRRPPP